VGGGSCLAVFVPLFVLGSPLATSPLSPPPSAEGRVAGATVSLANQMGVRVGGGEEVRIREHRIGGPMGTSWNQLTSNVPQ
jgi:hypothetical protein